MRHLANIFSKSSYNVELWKNRNLANCRLCQFYTNRTKLKKAHETKKNPELDNCTSFAMAAIKEYYTSKNVKRDHYFRLLDKKIAVQFADLIMSHSVMNPSCMVEINPAFGFLTQELLDAGVPKINLFESIEHFHADLAKIQEKYFGRVSLKTVPFDYAYLMYCKDSWKATSNLDELLEYVEEGSGEGEPSFHIIGAVPNNSFIIRVMNMIIYRSLLTKYGRMVLHLAMPENVWISLSSANENYRYYTWRSILFQICFNYQLLGTLPRKAFYPSFGNRPKQSVRWTVPRYDVNTMCVVRIEEKSDLDKYGLTEQDMVPLYHFIRHHYRKRKGRLIPEMEKWVPGCGRDLIAAGYDIVTQFGELLPDEVVKLFLLFKSWPGYDKSSFMSVLDGLSRKIDDDAGLDVATDKIDAMFEASKQTFNVQAKEGSYKRQNKFADVSSDL